MNKYAVSIIANLLYEIKTFKKYENCELIKTLLNNEITESRCISVQVNNSPIASAFYGVIVYPQFYDLDCSVADGVDYAIEIQQVAIDLFEPTELAALLIHDISHNILTNTVSERLNLAIIKACRATSMKIVLVKHNIDRQMLGLAVLDIANRTLKAPVVPGTDMYEADRILVDLEITDAFNSALTKMVDIDYLNLSMSENESVGDDHIALRLVKMAKETPRRVNRTYEWLRSYLTLQYDTKVFDQFPDVHFKKVKDEFGAEVLHDETLTTIDVRYLEERAVEKIKRRGNACAKMIMEAASAPVGSNPFGSGRISYSAMQKELDVINFKMDSITSNYERLALLDRIYDNIFSLEKYLEKNPNDKNVWDIMNKFIDMTSVLKDAKISKRKYGVFVEVPAGYEG